MPQPKKLSKVAMVVEGLDWRTLREAFLVLVAEGQTEKEAARNIARIVDELLPLDQIVKGALGVSLEAVDGPLLRVAITVVLLLSERGK